MNNEIENIFREKFDNFEATPREGLFDAILAKRKRKRRALWMWSAAALVLLGTSVGVISSYNADSNTDNSIANDKTLIPDESSMQENDTSEYAGFKTVDHFIDTEKSSPKDLALKVETNKNSELTEDSKKELATSTKQRSLPIASNNRIIPKDIRPVEADPSFTSVNNTQTTNQDLAELYKQIAAENKNTDLTKATLFTKTGTLEIDYKREPISPKSKTEEPPHSKSEEPVKPINTSTQTPEIQDKTTTTPPIHKLVKLSRWSIETSAAAGVGSRDIKGEQQYVALRDMTESSMLSNSWSVNGIYQFNPKWNVQSGINLINRKENFEYTSEDKTVYTERTETKTETVIHPVLGEIEREYTLTVKDSQTIAGTATNHTNRYRTVSIPIVLERTLLTHNKWSILAKGGTMVSIYSKTSGIVINGNSEITDINSGETRQQGMVSGIFGLGAMFTPSDRISLVLYPQTNVGINSSYSSRVAFTQREMGLYIHTGLRIKL